MPRSADEQPADHLPNLSFAGPVTCSNSRRSCRSDSPTHLLRQSAPFLMKKETFLSPWLHSLASARATSVFPVPGGP